MRGIVYTVHQKADAPEPSERIVLVREGFSVWAFVFGLVWLLAHRCWRMSAIFLLMLIALGMAGGALGLSELTISILQLGLQFWLGGIARDCQRASLARSGYKEVDVIAGESDLLAERRYYDRLALRASH